MQFIALPVAEGWRVAFLLQLYHPK